MPVPRGGQAPSARLQRKDEAPDRRPALSRRRSAAPGDTAAAAAAKAEDESVAVDAGPATPPLVVDAERSGGVLQRRRVLANGAATTPLFLDRPWLLLTRLATTSASRLGPEPRYRRASSP